MKDIIGFSTETGLSDLIFKEIPYRQLAYIYIRQCRPGGLSAHLAECIQLCRMAGALQVYATGSPELEAYPLHTRILRMQATAQPSPELVGRLFPVTEQTAGQWRQVYNQAFRQVPNAGTLEQRDEKALLAPGAYFVHDQGQLLGIGWLKENQLEAVASVVPGAGLQVMHTMISLIPGEQITLQVASTNTRALRLYEKLGFVCSGLVSQWHRVFPEKEPNLYGKNT